MYTYMYVYIFILIHININLFACVCVYRTYSHASKHVMTEWSKGSGRRHGTGKIRLVPCSPSFRQSRVEREGSRDLFIGAQ